MNKTASAIKKWLRRITNVLSYVLLAAIVILIVFVFVNNVSGKPIFVANHSVLWVLTGSMEPEIPEKSYILIEKVPVSEIQEGDVIVFYSDDPSIQGQKNTHRVVEIVGDHEAFVTKGDNNAAKDNVPARASAVIGVYREKLPFLTKIGRFLATKIGLIVAFTLIFAILMLLYMPDMMRITKERQAELDRQRQEMINKLVQEEMEKMRQAETGKDDDHV
ncbi:MAG: signal peptidase I [Clostridia bacterium]|nr:signal peptidase I [Clostridia bacterium]